MLISFCRYYYGSHNTGFGLYLFKMGGFAMSGKYITEASRYWTQSLECLQPSLGRDNSLIEVIKERLLEIKAASMGSMHGVNAMLKNLEL